MSTDLVKLGLLSAATAQVLKMSLKGQRIPQKEIVLPVLSALAAKYMLDKNLNTLGFKTDQDMKFWGVSLASAWFSLNQL